MLHVSSLIGALLLAAPPSADPILKDGRLHWFELTESQSEVAARIGRPAAIAPSGTYFISWQYHLSNIDHHDASHIFVFRRSDGRLLSVTRIYDPERPVDPFFPASETSVYHQTSGNTRYPVRVRQLSGGRYLLALGVSRPGDPTSQLVLMHRDALRAFYPWLAAQIKLPEPRP